MHDLRFTQPDVEFPQLVNRNSCIVLQVADTGPGIAPEHLPRIFERFYQVDATSTRSFEGTGIGLAFVKELAELLGGTVAVESRVNEGSTFTVRMPVEWVAVPEAESPKVPEAPKPPKGAFRSGNEAPFGGLGASSADAPLVLVVEDNDELRQYLAQTLAPAYRVRAVGDGQAGLEQALDLVPDLVVSDVMMPRMDGYALVQALKTDLRTSHVPVVLLTARASLDSRLRGLGLGADAYLGKPFSPDELLLTLRNTLQTRRAWQAVLANGPAPANGSAAGGEAVPEKERQFLERLRDLVLENLGNDALDVDWLVERANLSRTHLHRKLTALTGHGTTRFINQIRLEQARALLREGELNVTEVAYRVGFGSPSYFTRVFQEHFGHPPTKARE